MMDTVLTAAPAQRHALPCYALVALPRPSDRETRYKPRTVSERR